VRFAAWDALDQYLAHAPVQSSVCRAPSCEMGCTWYLNPPWSIGVGVVRNPIEPANRANNVRGTARSLCVLLCREVPCNDIHDIRASMCAVPITEDVTLLYVTL
jgi:hypothetical protein